MEYGYDSVYIDKSMNLVRFVQITKAAKHSLKLKNFKSRFFWTDLKNFVVSLIPKKSTLHWETQ